MDMTVFQKNLLPFHSSKFLSNNIVWLTNGSKVIKIVNWRLDWSFSHKHTTQKLLSLLFDKLEQVIKTLQWNKRLLTGPGLAHSSENNPRKCFIRIAVFLENYYWYHENLISNVFISFD